MPRWHGSILGFWGGKVGLQEWVSAYIIKKPWFCTNVSSVKNSALNTFYKKPIDYESKDMHVSLSEQTREVHDGTGTMIGIK
jgi:hypothetical protein